jgi:hypothetical protein
MFRRHLLRSILAIIAASAVLGASLGGSAASGPGQHVRDMVGSILQDVEAILSSFAHGPDDPKNPLVDPQTLKADESHLQSATQKARTLASELEDLANTDAQTNGR